MQLSKSLLSLKPSSDLEHVSMSSLARKGTALLQQLLETAGAVSVRVQGKGAMVTISQKQYDEVVALVQKLRLAERDGFRQTMSVHFDEMVARMAEPGAGKKTEEILFGDPEELARHYRPGATETKS